jgi:hypothetical protein
VEGNRPYWPVLGCTKAACTPSVPHRTPSLHRLNAHTHESQTHSRIDTCVHTHTDLHAHSHVYSELQCAHMAISWVLPVNTVRVAQETDARPLSVKTVK